jgi:sirohydrochlorin cobaltochelatase
MHTVQQRIAAQDPSVQVHCAYLELTQPDLAGATARLVAIGVAQITVVPMFLGVGRHAREDLPVLLDALRAEYPAVDFIVQCAVGEDPRLIEQLAKIALS